MKLLEMNQFSNVKYKTFNIPMLGKNLNYLKARYTTLKTYLCLNEGPFIIKLVQGFFKIIVNTLLYPFHNEINDGVTLLITGDKQ